jgi:hypothetical protein
VITEGNFRLTGLKQHDITGEIDNIINSAKEYIIICGYGFTSPKNNKSILKKVIDSPLKAKHCILPVTLFRGYEVNKPRAIGLIQNGISVSIENANHSKWIMNEKEIYYGSANFSIDSLENKIEVATFRNFLKKDPLKHEFQLFVKDSMNRMLKTSNRNYVRGYIGANNTLAQSTKVLIKRYNPSIEKVYDTIDSINFVRTAIYEIITNCFWYLGDKHYNRLAVRASEFEENIKSINYQGINLINADENSQNLDYLIKLYNKECDNFNKEIESYADLAKDFLLTEKEVPSFTSKNRKLTKQNIALIK